MLIEVVGVDGSGKSTLIDATRRLLHETTLGRAYERTIRSESRNLLESLHLADPATAFTVRDQELAVLLDAIGQAHGSLHPYRGSPVSHAFVTGYRCALLARLRTKGMDGDAGLRALVRHLPAPDLTVLTDVPGDVALDRIRSRHKGDQVLSSADPLSELERRATAARWAAGQAVHLRLDGTAPIAVLVQRLVSSLPTVGPQPGEPAW